MQSFCSTLPYFAYSLPSFSFLNLLVVQIYIFLSKSQKWLSPWVYRVTCTVLRMSSFMVESWQCWCWGLFCSNNTCLKPILWLNIWERNVWIPSSPHREQWPAGMLWAEALPAALSQLGMRRHHLRSMKLVILVGEAAFPSSAGPSLPGRKLAPFPLGTVQWAAQGGTK